MTSEFGARFKKARETQNITLEQIAKETRISTRFLLAIENEEFRVLPGGIFNRGFIRTYAQRVGLDPELVLAEYEKLSKPVEEAVVVEETAAPPASLVKRRQFYPAAVGALVLLIAIVYVVFRDSSGNVQPSGAPQGEPAFPRIESPVPRNTPADAAAAQPATHRALAAPNSIAVEMEVHEPTWIRLSADGAPVVDGEILKPGTMRRYTAHTTIDLTVGNAGGLTLKVNDKEVGSLGRTAQVRSLMITPDNVAELVGR